MVIGTVAVTRTQVTVVDRTLERTAIHRWHGDGVGAVLVLQGMSGYRVELVGTDQLDAELALHLRVVAVGAEVGQSQALCGVALLQELHSSGALIVVASHEAVVVAGVR